MTCMGVVPLHDLSGVEHIWQGDAEDDPRNVHHLAHHIIVRGLALQAARGCRQAPECRSGHPALALANRPLPLRIIPAADVQGCRLPSSWRASSLGTGAHAVLCCAGQASCRPDSSFQQSGLASSSGSKGRICMLRVYAI